MNDPLALLRDDIWAFCTSAQWWVKYSCFFIHFTGTCCWVKNRHLITCSFMVVFGPAWLLMSRTDIVDISLFCFRSDRWDWKRMLTKMQSNFFKTMRCIERSPSECPDAVYMKHCWAGKMARLRHRARALLSIVSSAISPYLTHWFLYVQGSVLLFVLYCSISAACEMRDTLLLFVNCPFFFYPDHNEDNDAPKFYGDFILTYVFSQFIYTQLREMEKTFLSQPVEYQKEIWGQLSQRNNTWEYEWAPRIFKSCFQRHL